MISCCEIPNVTIAGASNFRHNNEGIRPDVEVAGLQANQLGVGKSPIIRLILVPDIRTGAALYDGTEVTKQTVVRDLGSQRHHIDTTPNRPVPISADQQHSGASLSR